MSLVQDVDNQSPANMLNQKLDDNKNKLNSVQYTVQYCI